MNRLKNVPAAAIAGFRPFICVSETLESPPTESRDAEGAVWEDCSCEGCSKDISTVGGSRSWEASGATTGGSPGVSEECTTAGGYVGRTADDMAECEA